ncbi:MAG: hypothetical protein AB8A35_00710 [Prochlorococcus sp.]
MSCINAAMMAAAVIVVTILAICRFPQSVTLRDEGIARLRQR